MPRLLADGPALSVSPDQTLLAVAGGEHLRLLDARTHEVISQIVLPDDPAELGFAHADGAPRLVVLQRHGANTEARAYTLPRLELAGQVELSGAVRPAAFVGERFLVLTESGELPRLVVLGTRGLSVEPIALREPVQLAAATPDERLLVAARDQVECWDPVSRRALYRMGLPLHKPRQAAFAARQRLFWAAGATELEVFRFSDGRVQLRVELAGRFLAASGTPDSPRLVVARAEEGVAAPALEELDLVQQKRRPLEVAGQVASFCVVEGPAPQLVTAAADSFLRYQPLPAPGHADPPVVEADRVQPRPHAVREPEPRTARPAGGWRSRLSGLSGYSPRPATPPSLEPVGGDEPSLALAPEPAEAARASRPPLLDNDPTEPRARSSPPGRESWRERLLDWAESAAGDQEPARLDDLRTPVADLGRRFELGERAQAALGLLYASWLRGEEGLPAADLARALSARPARPAHGDDDEAWLEALGRGELGREGLALTRRGRVRLRPTVGRYLDGAPPRIELVMAQAPLKAVSPALTGGALRVALPDEEDRKAARTIARRLGQDVALIDLSSSRPAERQLLEARLHGAIPLVSGDPPALERALAQLPRVVMLVGYRGYCPEALANLPIFEVD